LPTNPRGYCQGLALFLHLGGLDLRKQFLNLMYFTEALMVAQWMRRRSQAHLHCHLGQQAATVGLYVRNVCRRGFSITVHGPDEFYDVKGQYLARKIAAADFVVCISSFARSRLMLLSPRSHWDKFIVSRLGVDPQLFSPPDQKPSNDVVEILCVGRLVPSKGQHILIAAVDRLVQQSCPVRLRIAGSGPDESSLQAHAAQLAQPSCVCFEGAVDQDRIRTLYAAADIFCLPSFAEGVPVALMEAMSMGLPCVTTNITGIPELIRDGIEGLLVSPSDLDALVEALAKLIDDATLRQRLANGARKRILEHYNLHRNVQLLASYFAERVGP
jgi:glycosyltransferase involved in cell wall biosynthesis